MSLAPVRLDRLQKGLYSLLSAELSPALVSWGRMDAAQEQVTTRWLSLMPVAGPTPERWGRSRAVTKRQISSAVITVPTPSAGQMAIVEINLAIYRHEATAGQTATQVRDALLALIQAGESAWGVTAVSTSTNQITLTPSFAGGLWHVDIAGILTGTLTQGPDAIQLTSGQYVTRIQLDAFAKKGVGLIDDAHALLAQALAALHDPDVVQRLSDDYGVALGTRRPATDTSAIAGAYWESRATSEIVARQVGVSARALTTIETATLGIGLDFPGAPTTVTFPLSP